MSIVQKWYVAAQIRQIEINRSAQMGERAPWEERVRAVE